MRVKSIEQQALQGLHRTRSLWMATRTSRINALRGFCREFGIVIAQGSRLGVEQIGRVLADPHSAVPELSIRGTMILLVEEIRLLEVRIAQLERELTALARTIAGVHYAAVDPRRRLAHRDRDGRRNLRQRRPLSRCTTLRLLVRPHSQGVFLRQYPPPRPHLQTRRPLPAHAAHPRRAFGTARGHRRGPRGKTTSMACGNGRSPCSSARITTRPPAPSPTSWQGSAMRRCVTANRTVSLI